MNLREYAAKINGGQLPQGIPEADQPRPAAPTADTAPAAMADYRGIYKAVYNFHSRHERTEKTLEEWNTIADELNAIANDYNQSDFVISLLMAVLDELERKDKGSAAGKGENNS